MDKEFVERLLSLYPLFHKIYGPYTDKNNDNREIILLYGNNGLRRTLSWPKAMMEVKLNRLLNKDELVDHINEIPFDNDYNNFQLLTPQENINKSRLLSDRQRKYFTQICNICGIEFSKYLNHVKHNRKQGKAGPFCSRRCAGKYGKQIQINNARVAKLVETHDA